MGKRVIRKMKRLFLFSLLILSICFAQSEEDAGYMDDDIEDPLSIGGGTQQTCDACRTVMDQLLQEWHSLDNDAFLEAIDEASHKNEYVPVVPEDEVFHLSMCFHIIEEEKGF